MFNKVFKLIQCAARFADRFSPDEWFRRLQNGAQPLSTRDIGYHCKGIRKSQRSQQTAGNGPMDLQPPGEVFWAAVGKRDSVNDIL